MKFGEGVPERGFKTRTIEKIIKGKVNHWINSVVKLETDDTDEVKNQKNKLRAELQESYIVTGGAITSMLQGYEPNDFDIYFNNVDTAVKVADHYLKQIKTTDKVSQVYAQAVETRRVRIVIKSAGIATEQTNNTQYEYFEMLSVQQMREYFEKLEVVKEDTKDYKILNMNTNAITLSNDVQLILRFVGPPEEIHKNYDFVHCTNYYTEKTGLVVNEDALLSTMSKELRYVGSVYPICSMFRIKKFIRRGWTINAGEMLKIAWDISKLNLSDMAVLQDQLVGVDAAYFHQMLDALKTKGDISRTYLFEVVNRVFNDDTHEGNE